MSDQNEEKRRSLNVSAKTVDEAIEQGLAQLGLPRDQVDIEIIKEGKRGVFGLGAEEARVRLTPREQLAVEIAPEEVDLPPPAPAEDIPGYHDQVVARTPLGRLGEVGDVAEAVLALFRLEWVTGQTLACDGGVTLYSGTTIEGV